LHFYRKIVKLVKSIISITQINLSKHMTIKKKLEYLRSLKPSSLPEKFADALKDYLEIADAVEDDAEMLKEVGIYDDIEKLYDKAQTFGQSSSPAKKRGSSRAKATKQRASKAKAARASRSSDTKKKAEKRASSKPKATPKESQEKFTVGSYVKVKSTGFVLKVVKNRGVEGGDYIVEDLDGDQLRANQGDLVLSSKPKAKRKAPKKKTQSEPKTQDGKFKVGTFVKVKSTGYVMKVVKNSGVEGGDYIVQDLDGYKLLANKGDLELSEKPRAAAKPREKAKPRAEAKPRAASKSQEKQEEKLKSVKAEFNAWVAKVDKEETKLRKVIELVSPTVKAEGLGLTKIQAEIKQYEAYITILKRIYARDARMMKTIMDRANKALKPSEVESLQRAIVKAQDIVKPSVAPKKGLLARIFS
jgi:hypothetical protein